MTAKELTVMEAVNLAEGYLSSHGIESPRLSAEHLLAKTLGCSRLDLYLRFDECPGKSEIAAFREDIKIRSRHYPLQYILGRVEFFSRSFSVAEGVFIPRPETELLVERVEEICGMHQGITFLEFGVGSGVISGTLAARHPGWSGCAFDVSPAAAALAARNFAALGISNRLSVFVAEGFSAIRAPKRFDCLIANPPYIPSADIAGLQPEVAFHESRTALDGGEDGMKFYPSIARAGADLLDGGGLIALEIGDAQAAEVGRTLESCGFERVSVRKDYNGYERVITAHLP
jgi:release factor glutamine methyltransferase